jgi:hypothetical protein
MTPIGLVIEAIRNRAKLGLDPRGGSGGPPPVTAAAKKNSDHHFKRA